MIPMSDLWRFNKMENKKHQIPSIDTKMEKTFAISIGRVISFDFHKNHPHFWMLMTMCK